MDNIKIEDIYPNVEKSKIVNNQTILENCWQCPQKINFSESYREFYPPSVWFIGKKRIFEKDISKAILNAKEIVIISSFLLQDTEIIKAILVVSSYTRVYVITATENRLKSVNFSEEGLEEERVKDHLDLLKKLKKKCLIRTAPHFHAKFILIDPKNRINRQGFLSTANLTQHALANNVEIGIMLNKAQIIDLFNLFCTIFWYESKHEFLSQFQLKGLINETKKEIPKKLDFQHIIAPNKTIDFKSTLINTISNFEGDIYLSAYSIEESNDVYNLLIKQLENGRKINLFIRPREKIMPTLLKLKEAGAEIFGHSLLHMKVLIIDNPQNKPGLIFTGNLTEQSFSESFDIGIFLDSFQKEKILEILKRWKYKYIMKFTGNKQIGNLVENKYQIWNPKRLKIQVKDHFENDLGEFEGKNIDNYKNFEPSCNIPSNLKFKYKKIKFKWTNVPPKLPKNAEIERIKVHEDTPKKIVNTLKMVQIFKSGSKRYLKTKKFTNIEDIRYTAKYFNAKIVI